MLAWVAIEPEALLAMMLSVAEQVEIRRPAFSPMAFQRLTLSRTCLASTLLLCGLRSLTHQHICFIYLGSSNSGFVHDVEIATWAELSFR